MIQGTRAQRPTINARMLDVFYGWMSDHFARLNARDAAPLYELRRVEDLRPGDVVYLSHPHPAEALVVVTDAEAVIKRQGVDVAIAYLSRETTIQEDGLVHLQVMERHRKNVVLARGMGQREREINKDMLDKALALCALRYGERNADAPQYADAPQRLRDIVAAFTIDPLNVDDLKAGVMQRFPMLHHDSDPEDDARLAQARETATNDDDDDPDEPYVRMSFGG